MLGADAWVLLAEAPAGAGAELAPPFRVQDGPRSTTRSATPHATRCRAAGLLQGDGDGDELRAARHALRGDLASAIARETSHPDGLDTEPMAIVDRTLVTLRHGHNHGYVKPQIRRADVLRICDSLRANNTPAKR